MNEIEKINYVYDCLIANEKDKWVLKQLKSMYYKWQKERDKIND
jgi:hypothetical protein